MPRNARQKKILELVSSQDIETQSELAATLRQLNFSVTQATVSRDIKELGLIKISTGTGRQRYVQELSDRNILNRIGEIFKSAVLSIKNALNIVVVKTLSGCAAPAGIMIDKLESASVLGSVSGDDTIIIVTASEEAAGGLADKLGRLLV